MRLVTGVRIARCSLLETRPLAVRALAVVLCVAFAACSKPARKANETHNPADNEPFSIQFTKTKKATRRAPPASADANAGQELDVETVAAALLTEWAATDDMERRSEIALALAEDGSPAARAILEEIYTESSAVPDKVLVVQSLSSMDLDEPQPTARLIEDALGESQPPELRAAAVGALTELNDPRTLPYWRALATDDDEAIREQATAMLEYFGETPPAQETASSPR